MRCPECDASLVEELARCPGCGLDLQLSPTLAPDTAAPTRTREIEFQPGQLFAGRYTIIERAGEGGMGVVYKAIDTSLNQVVALKLIRASKASAPDFVERFKREVRITRLITHPNVCRVHDLGESGGVLYLSMEWIPGETLRQLLGQARALSRERALEIAERVTAALAAAHARGIIHRDLKPENIMIGDRGDVYVMDFGLAVQEGAEYISGEIPVGTPRYMSPEQRDLRPVDARSDLFALGLILREMLTGRPIDPTRLHRETDDAQRTGPVAGLLRSLLALDRERRAASAESVAKDLELLRRSVKSDMGRRRAGSLARWGIAAALLAAAAIAYSWLKLAPGAVPGPPVLTSYQRGLQLREQAETVRAIDDAIQMFNRALEADPESPSVWAAIGEAYWKRFEWNHQASSREEAIRAVDKALALDPNLPEARNARGRGFIAERDFERAKVELEAAVRARPGFDVAWANLGSVYQKLNDYPAGMQALQQAVELRPDSARYRIMLGNFFYQSGEFDEAAAAFRVAIDLKPASAMAWNSLGTGFLQIGHPLEAVEAFERCLELEDRPSARSNLGTAYYHLKRYSEAAAQYRRATQLEPAKETHWGNLGDALRKMNRHEEADAAYGEAVVRARQRADQTPRDAQVRVELGLWCARARQEGCALSESAFAVQLQPGSSEILFRRAIVFAVLGRHDEALEWLRKAVNIGLSRAEIENEPDLEPLRADPGYERILDLAS